MKHPLIEVVVIGDKVSKNANITAGAEAISKIRQMTPDLCIMGINAIDVGHGITDNDWDVVQLKRAMIESARKTVCLTITEKINTSQPLQVCTLDQIDILITESDPSNELLQPYKEAGVQVL